MNTTNAMATNEQPTRTVYVVRREVQAHDRVRFIAAETTAGGHPREYSTPAEAHAAAARMGGAAKGFRVLEEWRTAAGVPCSGPMLES